MSCDSTSWRSKRARVLKDDELRKIWPVLTTLGYPFGIALRMLLLTAVRRAEVEQMQWAELDLARGLWAIPAERTKTEEPLLVPLSPLAVDLLSSAPRLDGRFVFTTRPPTHISDWSGVAARVRERSGVDKWTIHDFRRTVRTNLSKLGVPADIGERVLGHAMPGVRPVYDKWSYLPEKRDALERWADHLAQVVKSDA